MEIQPDKQNLDQVFSTTVYYIDFYQRDYKWTDEPVKRLLQDVFYEFDQTYKQHSDLEPNRENINARYPWYYLNTYVTNTVNGRVFVVDGQQRLTTLTLILLKLHSMAKVFGSKTAAWLERKIAGYSGTEELFWMHHVRHLQVLKGLMDGKEGPADLDTSSGITAVNMVKNYQVISADLQERLTEKHKFETFVHYFLFRLVLINLSVDITHVPMVFEVINDRGVRLKPYEILKGKLLGQIDKIELDKADYNGLWEAQVARVNTYREDEIDSFFRYWLKAKFANTRKAAQRFDGDYHRELFKQDINAKLGLDHHASNVKAFLSGAFKYFTGLYSRVWDASKTKIAAYPAVYFNSLNELDSQFMLILSACRVDDPEEHEKIAAVSAGLDRIFVLLQLQGAYDSNEFAGRLYEISTEIREQSAAVIPEVFDKHLRLELKERRGIVNAQSLSYTLFRPMSVDRLNRRFTKYFFARIEQLVSVGMKREMPHSFYDLVILRGPKSGFHVEHILARNAANRALFGNDEERFEQERNRLGGVLLMKGRDNQSSNAEEFMDKLKSYENTLHWNQTMRPDMYKSKLDFRDFCERHGLPFRSLTKFGPEELEERHKLLFDLVALTWHVNVRAPREPSVNTAAPLQDAAHEPA